MDILYHSHKCGVCVVVVVVVVMVVVVKISLYETCTPIPTSTTYDFFK